MKKIILLLLTLSMHSLANSQSIFKKADSLFYAGDLELAIEEYQSHPDSLDSNFYALSNLACNYALMGNSDSAFAYLDKLIDRGITEWVLSESSYYFIYNDKRWDKLKEYVKDYVISKGYSKPDLCLELLEIGMLDQAYYFDITNISKKIGRSYFVINHLWKLKKELNAENLKKIEVIIKENGYPKLSEVGDHAASVAFLVIQHSDLKVQKKYLPLITEMAEQGEIYKEDWALLLDRVRVNEGKKQVFGSQVHKNPETGIIELYPVEDEKNLNKRRAEIDLMPIEKYLKFMGIEYIAPK